MKHVLMVGLLVLVSSGPVFAQSALGSTEPTAGLDAPPRAAEELNFMRGKASDAVLAGGATATLTESRVTMPGICDIDPTASGCEEGGDSTDPSGPPAVTHPNPIGHCGIPWDMPPNNDPAYMPVSGGWYVDPHSSRPHAGQYLECP